MTSTKFEVRFDVPMGTEDVLLSVLRQMGAMSQKMVEGTLTLRIEGILKSSEEDNVQTSE